MQNIYQKQSNTLRDAGIYEKYHISQRGVSHRKLGGQYNLTGSRIQQIVKRVEKEMGIPDKKLSTSTPIDTTLNRGDNKVKR